jgi:hypothetical protein
MARLTDFHCQHAPRLAWGLLNVGTPASSNSRRRSWAHRGIAWRCSSARLCARFVLAWIQRASSESFTPNRGGSFAETTRTRRRVDLWSLRRCGSGPSGIHRRPKTWESMQCVRCRAPGQSSSVAGSNGKCVVRSRGRCTVRLVGRDGREFRPSGR